MFEGQNINNVALQLGDFKIYWYGVIIASAILLCFYLCTKEVKRRGYFADLSYDIFLCAIIPGVIGARLYFLLFYNGLEGLKYFFQFRDGGLAIYGAIIGGALGIYFYSVFKKFSFIKILDIITILVPLGQAMGRWGNFFNQEAYGNLVTNKALKWFPCSVYINDPKVEPKIVGWYQATFFYESLWCVLVFGFLMWYRKKQKFNGELALMYLGLYGLERTFVELLRTDSLLLWGTSIRVSSLLAGILFVACLGVWLYKTNKIKQIKDYTYIQGDITKNTSTDEEEAI